MIREIERDEHWLAALAPVGIDAGVLVRLKERVRVELTADGVCAISTLERLSIPHETPDEALLARVRQAVRAELTTLAPGRSDAERRQRRFARTIILWGAGCSAAAAALLLVAIQKWVAGGREDGRGRQSVSSDTSDSLHAAPDHLAILAAALNRPADEDEQVLRTLDDDVAAAEEQGVKFVMDYWDDGALDELNDALDDLMDDVDSPFAGSQAVRSEG